MFSDDHYMMLKVHSMDIDGIGKSVERSESKEYKEL